MPMLFPPLSLPAIASSETCLADGRDACLFDRQSDNKKGQQARKEKKTKYRQKIANHVALSIFNFSAHSVNVKMRLKYLK